MDRAVVLCTPHLVKEGLVDDLLVELKRKVSYRIIFRLSICLTGEDVEVLYPRLIHETYFPQIKECLLHGKAEFILISAENIHQRLNAVKGKFRYKHGITKASGLRKRYLKDCRKFEFIFHSTDSNEETDVIGIRLFGSAYLQALAMEHVNS